MKDKSASSADRFCLSSKKIKIMEVCGTHTAAISKYGLREYFSGIELISGPGCPVCVTPSNRLEQCIMLARAENTIIATFGDMLRVPSVTSTLEKEMSNGADIRVIYSIYDSLKIAENNPGKKIVFLGAGFETTAPLAAAMVEEACRRNIKNYFLFSMFKSVFPALKTLTDSKDFKISGFILPGNVAAVTGYGQFRFLWSKYGISCAVTGFGREDIISSVKNLSEAHMDKKTCFYTGYKSVVSEDGNIKARHALDKVFELKDDNWRGLGKIKKSGFRLRGKYSAFDAEKHFVLPDIKEKKDLCRCGDIMKGKIIPFGCALFAKKCTPENPAGPCMVSSEGVCSAYYKYG